MRRILSSLALVVMSAASLGAQRIALGTGVDTTARANREVFGLWRDYLRDRGDSVRAIGYWTRDERARWPVVDLTASWIAPAGALPDGMTATVVELGPDVPGDTTTFIVRTLFARDGKPVALARVYAVRDGDAWALANALPRLTRDWPRLRAGRIDFTYQPGHRIDSVLASRAARFVDSAIVATGVTPPTRIAMYLASSPREVARVLGLDFGLSANSGRVYPEDAVIVSGAASATEWNAHDLSHVVLGTLTGPTGRWWSEGAAVWIGGRGGRDFARLVRELDADLVANPTRTLDSLVAPHAWRDTVSATAAAVLVRLAFERGKLPAVRALVSSPYGTPDDVRRAAAIALGIPPEQVADAWRRAVATMK